MQAGDYRFVDVSGIVVADKILPKMDGADGGWMPRRAEDEAFILEALAERPYGSDPVTQHATIVDRVYGRRLEESDSDSDSYGGLGPSVQGHIARRVYSMYHGRYYCDALKLPDLVSGYSALTELQTHEVDLPTVFPWLFTPLAIEDKRFFRTFWNERYGRASTDDIRAIYHDLLHNEAHVSYGYAIHLVGASVVEEADCNGRDDYVNPIDAYAGTNTSVLIFSMNWDKEDQCPSRYRRVAHFESVVVSDSSSNPHDAYSFDSPVVVVFPKVNWYRDGTNRTWHFVKVINSLQPERYGESLAQECVDAVGAPWTVPDSGHGSVTVHCWATAICPFVGRTKLRDIAWNWTPSSS